MTIKKTELEKLVRALRTALSILEAELEPIEIPPEIQQEVARKMAARTCLAWDHQIPDGDEDHRGLCSTDYATTMARIRRGEESEAELMKQGKLAPKGRPGRPAAKDVAADKLKRVAEDVEKFKRDRAKRKGKSNE